MGVVGLDEDPAVVDTPSEHLGVDVGPQRPPAIDRSVEIESLDGLDGTVGGHPRHDLGVSELPPRPPHLPDPLIGVAPRSLEEVQEHLLQRPCVIVVREPGERSLVEGVGNLAVDVQLELVGRRVADPNWP